MRRLNLVFFAAAVCLFAVFFTNVAMGAALHKPFLSDVSEMLMLLASVAFFVIGVLMREAGEAAERGGDAD